MITSTCLVVDTYQSRLPMYHPFVNAPVLPTPLQNPVNVYVNGVLTNNTPNAGALAAHVHAHTPSPVPPAPSTPIGSSTPFGPSTSVDVPKPKAPRAKKGSN